jgi:cellulose synthase operon protein C
MDAIVFPSEDALAAALLARLVPDAAVALPVLVGHRADGAVEVHPQQPLDAQTAKTLAMSGAPSAPATATLTPVSCWAAAVRTRTAPIPDGALPLALFEVDAPRKLLPLAADLLRLGCDRQELALTPDGALLRARTPPFYVVDGAREGLKGVRVYVPSPPSQDGVWVELGHRHPLTAKVAPPASGVLLIRGDGTWALTTPGPWRPLESLLDPVLAPATQAVESTEGLPRLEVQLRLEPSSRGEAASFWVLREKAKETVEAMVRSVPSPQLDALGFCVAEELVVLRARPGRESQVPDVPGAAYARVAQLPNLLAPVGTHLAPPLPREFLRTWLAADTELVTWLEQGDGALRRMQVRESAFRPLSEWVDYVIDTSSPALEAWVKSARFDLAPYIGVKGEAVAAPPDKQMVTPTPPDPDRQRRPAARPGAAPGPRIQPPPLPPVPRPSPAEPLSLGAPKSRDEAEKRLAVLEAEFLGQEHGPDSAERRAQWISLARAYSAAGRAADAGLAWAHSIWEETDPPTAARLAREWTSSGSSHAEALLAVPAPTADQTRALASHVLAAALERVAPPAAPARLVAWFDQHEENLDVRTLWLARAALSRLSGGDTLMLARARDQVLQRLQRGLSLSRDVPQFLRVGGPGGGADVDRTSQVTQQLEALLRAFDETQRKRKPAEAPWKLTRAYVQLEFAWGLARMGASDRARVLAEQASASLPRDPVHDYLSLAYRARIQQALEGKPAESALPREVTAAYQGIKESMHKFIADRLRQTSAVLEPQVRGEAYDIWHRTRKGRVGDDVVALRGEEDAGARLKALEERAAYVADPKNTGDDRARVLASMIDTLPTIASSAAVPLLQRWIQLAERVPAEHRASALEAAIQAAGHFGQESMVRQLVASFGALLRELPPKQLADIGPALGAGVRSLRRLGLREQARELLTRASGLLKGSDTTALISRLSLAGGFASLGDSAAAAPIIDQALTALNNEASYPARKDRSLVSRATAQALGESPPHVALPGLVRLAGQLPFTSDTNQTSSHFCISLVDLADTLVLGHVGDALVLHASTRRFLEEDEDRVRRRVHREVQSGLS